MVELAERLIGKGYDLRVYDSNVEHGRDPRRQQGLHPQPDPAHLEADGRRASQEVLDHADTIVIGNGSPEFREVPQLLGAGQTIVDLVRISDYAQRRGRLRRHLLVRRAAELISACRSASVSHVVEPPRRPSSRASARRRARRSGCARTTWSSASWPTACARPPRSRSAARSSPRCTTSSSARVPDHPRLAARGARDSASRERDVALEPGAAAPVPASPAARSSRSGAGDCALAARVARRGRAGLRRRHQPARRSGALPANVELVRHRRHAASTCPRAASTSPSATS